MHTHNDSACNLYKHTVRPVDCPPHLQLLKGCWHTPPMALQQQLCRQECMHAVGNTQQARKLDRLAGLPGQVADHYHCHLYKPDNLLAIPLWCKGKVTKHTSQPTAQTPSNWIVLPHAGAVEKQNNSPSQVTDAQYQNTVHDCLGLDRSNYMFQTGPRQGKGGHRYLACNQK